jgi:hypothetical protein
MLRLRPEQALDTVVRYTRSAAGKNGEGTLPIGRLRPIQDDDPAFRIGKGVRHLEKGKIAAVVDHQMERSSREHHGRGVMLATVREDANVRPADIRSQRATRGDVLWARAASRT